MILQKLSILFFLSIFSIQITTNEIEEKKKYSYSVNIDSLISVINSTGWNDTSLNGYSFYLFNSQIDISEERKKLISLPESNEKTFLHSLLLKREQEYSMMFDSLFLLLKSIPDFLSFYDELVFAANAAGQVTLLESKYSEANLTPFYFNYLNGIKNTVKGNYEQAVNDFSASLKIDSSEYHILYQLSYAYRNLGDYEKAHTALLSAITMGATDVHFLIKADIAEGTLNYLSGNYKNAEKLYRNALSSSKKIHDTQNEITSLINLGIIYDLNSDVETARNYFEQGLNIAKSINDIEAEAFALSEAGVSYTYTNNMIEAKQNYLQSYSLYKKVNNRLRLSFLSENIGKIFLYFFDYQTALEYYEKGLEYAAENKQAQAVNLIGIADIYANLSNYSKALKYYKDAEEITSGIKAISLNSQIKNGLGSLNFNLKRYNNALRYFLDAEEQNIAADDIYSLADVQYKTGLTYLMMDSLSLAENYLINAVSLSGESGDYYTEALSFINLSSLEIKKENFTKALSYLKKGASIAGINSLNYLNAECSLLEGEINVKQNNFNSAQNNFLNALELGTQLNEYNIRIEACRSLGELFSKNSLTEAAESYYKQAIGLIEDVSYPLFHQEDVQISYFSGRSSIYNSLADFYLQQNEFEPAFEVIDKSRSRSTFQNLANLKLESIVKNEELISKLYDYEWMIQSGIYEKAKTDSIRIQLSILKNKIIKQFPEAGNYLNRKPSLNVMEIRAALKENENLLTIYSNDNSTHFFLISRNNFKHFEVDVDKQGIINILKTLTPYYSNQMENSQTFFNQDLFSFNSAASYTLFNEVFKNVFSEIPAGDKVIIAPSGELLTVPLELLVVNYKENESPYNYYQIDFLINHFNISYTPSAALFIQQRNNNLMNENKIVVVGDPEINSDENLYAERRGLLEQSGVPRNLALLPLKYSEEEVNQVSDIINADQVFLNSRATETNFKLNAALSKIIHLSTHSFLYNKQPVIFFSNLYDAENDGFLEAGEIVQLKLNSDLVVLSSCNSGLGIIDNAEGILGMTKAFFEAGSKSMIVSLWEVNDKYTSKFMALFYNKLSEGFDKSEALRLAKLDFIKLYSPNPYYWGAFVLSGDVSEISFSQSVSVMPYLVVVFFIICFSLTIIFVYNKKIKSWNSAFPLQ